MIRPVPNFIYSAIPLFKSVFWVTIQNQMPHTHTHTHTARKNRTYTKHLVRGCHDQGNIPELNTFPFQINVTGWTCRNPRSRRTQFWNNALCGPKSFCPSFLPTYFSKEGKKCIPPRVFAACRCQKVRFSVNFYVV